MYSVYRIDTPSGIYIGITKNPPQRWYSHKKTSRVPENPQYEQPLYRAMRKHGSEVTFTLIEWHSTREQACEAEKFWVAECRRLGVTCYNISEGGDCPSPTAETRKKLGAASSARWARPGEGASHSEKLKRKWQDPEFRRLHEESVKDARKNHKELMNSEEMKAKGRERFKKLWSDPEFRERQRQRMREGWARRRNSLQSG